MKTNITLLCGNEAVPGRKMSTANDLTQNRQLESCRDARVPRLRARPALTMIWRTHPMHGRLECRWAADRGTATDEGVSCNNLSRKAA
jgi:hypothetical protein